jgi:hypothetical protein
MIRHARPIRDDRAMQRVRVLAVAQSAELGGARQTWSVLEEAAQSPQLR